MTVHKLKMNPCDLWLSPCDLSAPTDNLLLNISDKEATTHLQLSVQELLQEYSAL